MDATKGIHALITFFFALLIAYLGWPFIENFVIAIADDLLRNITWVTVILYLVVASLAVPALIALSDNETDATVISMVMGYGFFFIGILFMTILTPIIQLFVGGGITTTQILQEPFHIQLMTLLWVIAVLFSLVIGPVLLAVAPNSFETSKKINEAITV